LKALNEPTISVRVLKLNLQSFVELLGDDVYDFIEQRYGLTLADLEDDDRRVPIRITVDLINKVSAITKNPILGLTWYQRIGSTFSSKIFSAVYYTANIRGMLEMVMRYMHLISEMGEFKLYSRGEVGVVEFLPVVDPVITHHQIDAMLLGITGFFKPINENRFTRILLKHTCPGDCQSAYTEAFQTKVEFSQDKYALEFPVEWLKQSLQSKAISVDALVELEKLSSDVDSTKTFDQQLAGVMSSSLIFGEPRREEIATAWGISVSTMQRKLKAVGTSFQKVLETVRFEKAKEYLSDPIYTCEEVAFLVGYSEVRPFYIAFKRWTGTAPGQYRQSLCLD